MDPADWRRKNGLGYAPGPTRSMYRIAEGVTRPKRGRRGPRYESCKPGNWMALQRFAINGWRQDMKRFVASVLVIGMAAACRTRPVSVVVPENERDVAD